MGSQASPLGLISLSTACAGGCCRHPRRALAPAPKPALVPTPAGPWPPPPSRASAWAAPGHSWSPLQAGRLAWLPRCGSRRCPSGGRQLRQRLRQ
eukprot:5871926-Alexandrium_andersonii.AAC.1